jgi:hypothetical protein
VHRGNICPFYKYVIFVISIGGSGTVSVLTSNFVALPVTGIHFLFQFGQPFAASANIPIYEQQSYGYIRLFTGAALRIILYGGCALGLIRVRFGELSADPPGPPGGSASGRHS